MRRRKVLAALTSAVMVAATMLSGAVLSSSSSASVAATPASPVRAAFYYPWFPETWHSNDHYEPTLGRYDNNNRTVVAAHFAAMKYAGLDAAIASWWGQGTPTGGRLPGLLDAADAQGFSVLPYYEREFGDADPSAADVAADLDYMAGLVAEKPAWLHVGTQPALFVYNAGATGCADVTRWKEAEAQHQTNSANPQDWYISMKVFPGYESCPDQPDTWHQYGPAVPLSTHGNYHANVSPGFWHHNEATPRLERDLARFKCDLANMRDLDVSWELVTSFNEWGEGTSVEPATAWQSSTGYGDYLDAMRAVFVQNQTPTGCGGQEPSPTPTPTPDPTPTPTPTTDPDPTPVGGTYTAVEDASVRADVPTENQDTSTLNVDGSPDRDTLLRFTLPDNTGTTGTLRVWAKSSHREGFTVHEAGDAWSEGSVTWESRPTLGTQVGSSGGFSSGSWVEVPVTGLTAGDNTLALTTTSVTNMALSSLEDTNKPQLVVAGEQTESPSPSPTEPTPSDQPVTGQTVVWALGDVCDDSDRTPGCGQVGDLIAKDADADAVLILGDAQYEGGELSNFQRYYDPKMGAGKGLKGITWPAPGNHEYLTSGAAGYFDYFGAAAGDRGKGYYARTIGGWRIIATNTNCSKAGGCGPSSPQGQFIANELAKPEVGEIVFGHHPAISDGNYYPGTSSGKELFDIAYDGGAELFLSGHDHEYQRFAPRNKSLAVDQARGVRQIVAGAGGKNLTGFESTNRSEYRQNSKFGAVRLVLTDTGYTGQFVAIDGTVMDSFSGTAR